MRDAPLPDDFVLPNSPRGLFGTYSMSAHCLWKAAHFFTEWAPQLKRLPAVLSKLLAVQCNVRWPLRSVITSAQHRSISSDIERQNGAIAPSYGAIEVGPNMYSEFDSSAPWFDTFISLCCTYTELSRGLTMHCTVYLLKTFVCSSSYCILDSIVLARKQGTFYPLAFEIKQKLIMCSTLRTSTINTLCGHL